MAPVVPLFGPIPGGPELLIILMVIVLLFGANRLPELAHASGQAMGEFKLGREEVERDIRASRERAERSTDDASADRTDGVTSRDETESASSVEPDAKLTGSVASAKSNEATDDSEHDADVAHV